MNIAKNMEAIFFVAIALISATGFATASAPARVTAAAAPTAAAMQVVTITAKRLTVAEKAVAAQ